MSKSKPNLEEVIEKFKGKAGAMTEEDVGKLNEALREVYEFESDVQFILPKGDNKNESN